MSRAIHQLDNQTSSSIHAGLLYPSLTSVVVALASHSLKASQVSCIAIRICLDPEWQISCHDDAKGHRTSGHSFWKEIEESPLSFLAYLGVLDVQRGLRKHIQSGDDVIFSGLVSEVMPQPSMLSSSITVRDIFRHLPVRRRYLSVPSTIRSELECCRRALAVISTAYPDVQVTLVTSASEKERETELLYAARTSSIAARYQHLFPLPVNDTKFALIVNVSVTVKDIKIKLDGFVVRSLLSSRTHQHVIINGLSEELDDVLHPSQRTSVESLIQDLLQESHLESRPGRSRVNAIDGYRHYGFFLRIDTDDAVISQKELCKSIRASIEETLRAEGLMTEKENAYDKRRTNSAQNLTCAKRTRVDHQKPFKIASENFESNGVNLLDRSHLRRESDLRRGNSSAPDWLLETLELYQRPQCAGECQQRRESSTDRIGFHHGVENAWEESIGVDELRRGFTVGQVDAKFICIKNGDSLLALVDQHAAHERIRLEAILSDYVNDCMSLNSAKIDGKDCSSVPLSVSNSVGAFYKDATIMEVMGFWGFLYRLEGQKDSLRILFQSIPAILSSKLRQRSALEAFVNDIASFLENNDPFQQLHRLRLAVAANQDRHSTDRSWLFAQRYLPMPILELFHSISCRGAIMFNDPLSLSQCDTLISQLAKTTFPFQCAHGRPSLMLLCKLPSHPSWSTSAVDWTALA